MKFAEKKDLKLLEKDFSKVTPCDLRYSFSQGLFYPTGWFEEKKIFEIPDLKGLEADSKLLLNSLGMIPPKRIQFTAVPSHLTAVALFDDFFKCEFQFETSWYPYWDFKDTSPDQLVEKFRENCTISVSPEAYSMYSESEVECSVGMVQLLLLNFWLLSPDKDLE